ncbi:hypothetical protein F3Y22_tig00110114pilonHSYRG00342 [Hibiscus syriacus]|uniref:Uncharacterized protein n=1 Tax=Hibiscus syriacus TaxID=106335 RepID=A0A6A3BMD7_HIBSY|nr:anther-specific protein BCP1-like [Hibiscus syriacus]KAE8716578.1 hypothetical protein F3Y22_tig00110114pilonHSYRG00342 [Hibiscus syriacus]
MARQIFAFALVLIALIGLVSAANDADSTPLGPAIASTIPDVKIIGTIDDASAPSPNAAAIDVVATPLGSGPDAKNFAPPPSDATTVGVSTIQAAAITGAVVIAGYFVF